MGSGSTVAAVEAMGLHCVGVERHAEYVEAGADVIPRLEALGAALPTPAAPPPGVALLHPGLLRDTIDPVRAQLLHPGLLGPRGAGTRAASSSATFRPSGSVRGARPA
jgi:hypothetical protein